LQDLGSLGFWSEPVAINASGVIAGTSLRSDSARRAVRWTGNSPQELPIGANTYDTQATGMNDLGWITGYVRSGNPQHALLWGPDTSFIDLDAWLDAHNPSLGQLWTLTAATDINNAGFIVGWGTYNDGPGGLSDGQRAFLLDATSLVPEPGSTAALVIATVALAARRRGRRRH
jgi:hypothetical protein